VLSEVGAQPELEYALPGIDLSAYLRRRTSAPERGIYAEIGQPSLDLLAVIDEDKYKSVIEMPRTTPSKVERSAVGLWDTMADPGEERNLISSLPVRAAYHEQLLARWLVKQANWAGPSTGATPSQVTMTQELRNRLRAVGYLD
jgi:hypothetical protein